MWNYKNEKSPDFSGLFSYADFKNTLHMSPLLHSFTPKTTNVSTPILLSSTLLKTSSLQREIVLFTLIFPR